MTPPKASAAPSLLELCDKATPGPWMQHYKGARCDTRNGGEFVPIVGKDGRGWVADARINDSLANAQLIARCNPEVMRKTYEALSEMLFAAENADETGYVDGVGFIKDFDKLYDKAREALQLLDGQTKQRGA